LEKVVLDCAVCGKRSTTSAVSASEPDIGRTRNRLRTRRRGSETRTSSHRRSARPERAEEAARTDVSQAWLLRAVSAPGCRGARWRSCSTGTPA
jgi:hypothetical protein